MRGLTHFAPIALIAGGIALIGIACSSAKQNIFDVDGKDGGIEGGLQLPNTACQGLECKRVVCDQTDMPNPDGLAEKEACESGDECQSGICSLSKKCAPLTTTITGKVYDPAGKNPLYNVLVYIPGGNDGDAPLPEIKEGVQCETCASVALSPTVSTISNTKGEFTLENVPVDKDIPVVVQVGKWRRKHTFSVNKACKPNEVPEGANGFRLPKNGTEGDMPHIAVTAGGCDALECLLRGIGVDDSEFVAGADPSGHIHVFNGSGGKFPGGPAAGGSVTDPTGGELWNDASKMASYDMVMLSCECGESNGNKGDTSEQATASPTARQAMWDYANMGGRIFATHYHYTWFKNSPQPDWQAVANWQSAGGGGAGDYNVDTTFPKGQAFSEWLMAVNASTTPGHIQLTDVTDSMSSVNPPAQSWIAKSETAVRYFSFNTPTTAPEEEQCGRAVYSDLHLMGISAGGKPFPGGCVVAGGLSGQQKALEFMFFDLAGCVQSDKTPVDVPK